MKHALILGGTGLVGSSVAGRLAGSGWAVSCTGRDADRFPARLAEAGVSFIRSDRHHADEVGHVLAAGADVVIDCAGYTAAHTRMLLPFAAGIGSIVYLSSKAVYVDDHGRHANSAEAPTFAGPVTEEQATLEPSSSPSDIPYGSREGYGPNKVAAERVLLDSALPVSIIRPSRVHGVGAARPREWVFVRRILDGRTHVFLSQAGRGVNHPTAAVNLAALVETCAARPGTRILNCADPDAPTGLGIARIVAAHLKHRWTEVLLDGDPPDGIGDHPWNTWPPFILDTRAAARLGYTPVGDYTATVGPSLDALVQAARHGDPNRLLPSEDDPYFAGFSDYTREDSYLAQ